MWTESTRSRSGGEEIEAEEQEEYKDEIRATSSTLRAEIIMIIMIIIPSARSTIMRSATIAIFIVAFKGMFLLWTA